MRLRRSVLTSPGITRRRRGKGFAYTGPDGSPLQDAAMVQRIDDLVIPPAWKKVWISPFRNGHIQAVGTDVAGRRQYLYHERWQQERAEEKFDRVLALALHLLDRGYFRAGGEQYAEEHESYGIATLLCEHVNVRGSAVEFDYPAKSGVQRTLELEDREVARAVKALLRRGNRTERLLVCRAADRRAAREANPAVAQSIREKATRQLINRVGKGGPAARHPRGEPATKAA